MRRGRGAKAAPTRDINYRQLRSTFPTMDAVSADELEAIHDAALETLETLGVKVLLPAARDYFARAGARVVDDMVFIGRDIVTAALASAPSEIHVAGAVSKRDILLKLGNIVFQPGAGCPHATDRKRGRRPGTETDFRELVQLTQHFDVMHMVPPLVEPQDVPVHLRHYAMMDAQLSLTDKIPFVYSRGTSQVEDSFEMLKDFRGLSDDDFAAQSHCYTIINTNSPRQLDIPMALGLIDFAKAGQVSVVTPFTLMGAMAPITFAGAMMLSHAEAMMAITLTQLVKPGAPVCYGTFTSNVDMKSGAPAFGTPEHFKASLLAGQLARKLGLPWRCASGSAANINDAQAANETQFATWGCLLSGATIIIHAAGWLEGGLTISYEKMITDMEVLQMIGELCSRGPLSAGDIGLDALKEVQPGGHFFGADHTMARYQTEFYQPVAADWSNFGTWSEAGAMDADQRATGIWEGILRNPGPSIDPSRIDALRRFTAKRTSEGGALPEGG